MRNRLLVKALLWLHIKRIGRYKYGFLNMILITMMWYLIFLLGAITFVSRKEYVETTIVTFWGIILWLILNNWVWLIASWTWFALASGMVDEHIIYGVNPIIFIGGRFIVAFLITLFSIPLVILIFSSLASLAIYRVYDPVYIIIGVLYMIIYATLYSLILVALSLRTSVPGVMLDITTVLLYVGGGLGIPVYKMPYILRWIALTIPYTHAAEIVRYGALGLKPYLGINNEIIISNIYAVILVITTFIITRKSLEYIRKYGARAIGIM